MSAFISLLVLIVLSAVFSGTETAIFSLDRIRLKSLIDKGVPGARLVEKLRAEPKTLLGTLLLCNNAVNVAISALATLIALNAFGDAYIGAATFVITFLLVIFGEYMPKSYAAHNAERVATLVAMPVWLLMTVLRPVVRVIERIVRVFVRSDDGPSASLIGEEEIRTMARLGAKEGTVERGEKELIDRVFLLNDIVADDVLTPREEMIALDAGMTVNAAIASVNAQKYSRYPVRDPNGGIVAVVHIKDLLDVLAGGRGETTLVGTLGMPPVVVAIDTIVDDIFRRMKRERVHMAIVESPRGGVVGLVTLEDLLEELVGEIADETDIDEHVIKRIDKYTLLVSGDTDVSDINRFFNVKLDGADSRTIGRLVVARGGKGLKAGTPVMVAENLMAVVEETNRGRVRKVKLIKSEDRTP